MSHSAKERKQKRKGDLAESESHQPPTMENVLTKIPEGEQKITFEKLPESLPNGNSSVLPPGGPPSQTGGTDPGEYMKPTDDVDTSGEHQRSRHKSGSIRFGTKDGGQPQERDHYGPDHPGTNFPENREESEVDQNYDLGYYQEQRQSQERQHQELYRGGSVPEADAYQQQSHPKRYVQDMADEGDPFATDQIRSSYKPSVAAPDKSIARPRPRPRRQQTNPLAPVDRDTREPANPFVEQSW